LDRKLLQQCRKELMGIAALVAENATASSFAIEGAAEGQYEALLDKLLRSELGSRLSRSFVKTKLTALIGELALEPSKDRAEIGLHQLESDFDSVSSLAVFVPLSGFDAPDMPLELGRAIIRFIDEDALAQMAATISVVIDGTQHTDDDKTAFKAMLTGRLRAHVLGQVVAECTFAAEPVRAREVAEEETKKALDAIRYALPTLVQKGMRVEIGLMHEVFGGPKLTPIVDQSGKSFSIHAEAVGPLSLFKLDPESVQTMERVGVFQLGSILAKEAPTGLERSLIRSLRWFGTLSGTGEASYRLVSGFVCLETLLAPSKGEPISNYVAESAALLLSTERLENRCARKSTGGSNPPPLRMVFRKKPLSGSRQGLRGFRTREGARVSETVPLDCRAAIGLS
jgi:hypothetical protein